MLPRFFFVLLLYSVSIMSSQNYGIVVHGGAGVMSSLNSEQQKIIESKVSKTLISAYQILEDGGSSLDAVEFAVSEFEDSPLFLSLIHI